MSTTNRFISKMADELENEDDYELDYRRLKDNHLKAGYVEGLQAGEESMLQQGFNEGFAKSFACSSEFSKLSGSMSAVLSFLQSKHSNKSEDFSGLVKEIIKLKEEVKDLEEQALIECENIIRCQDDQGPTKSENNGNQRNCEESVFLGPSSAGNTDVCETKKKETHCQSGNCGGKDSDFQCVSDGTSTCSEDDCCRNADEQLGKNMKEVEKSTMMASNNNSTFNKEMERIKKHFRSLIENELNLELF